MRWGVEQRLEFIEFRLFWEGAINRSDLIEHFRISKPQASKDLSLYQERSPGNIRYNRKAKRYFAEPKFVLRFLEPDPYNYLSQLRSIAEGTLALDEAWIGELPDADAFVTPKRGVQIEVLRALLSAVRAERSLEIFYQSMNPRLPDPVWRRVTPHAFGHDGSRWHVRGYCDLERTFEDFLLPRILEAGTSGEPGLAAESDWLWNNYFELVVSPHPKLADSQKAVVAKDYGFVDGTGILSVRYAMLYYAAKQLGLLEDAERQDPRRQHIVAVNRHELQEALRLSENLGASTDERRTDGGGL